MRPAYSATRLPLPLPLHQRAAGRAARGFTLIELMVTVAIVAILAGIAFPAYSAYLVKGNRGAAQGHLLALSLAQGQYLADSRSYAATPEALGLPVPDAVSKYYTVAIDVQAGPPTTYTITATPVAGGRQAADGTLSINSAGARLPADKW